MFGELIFGEGLWGNLPVPAKPLHATSGAIAASASVAGTAARSTDTVGISANTPDGSTFATSTPTLEFTGTDGAGHPLRYQVQISPAVTFPTPSLCDSYAGPADNAVGVDAGEYAEAGQSFVASFGGKPHSAKFWLQKVGAPTGNCYAKLYSYTGTGGAFPGGVGDVLLATSNALDVSTIPGAYGWVTFTFSGALPVLAGGAPYVLMFEYSGGDAANKVGIGYDGSAPTHGGTSVVRYIGGSWAAGGTNDVLFEFYVSAPSINPIVDSYDGANVDGFYQGAAYGQSFHVTNGGPLLKARLWLKRTASVTGTLFVLLYSHKGTYGVTSEPDARLAITVRDPMTVPMTEGWVDFNFPSGVVLADNTNYVLAFDPYDTTAGLFIGIDGSAPAHSGNLSSGYANSVPGNPTTAYDMAFQVLIGVDANSGAHSGFGDAFIADSYSVSNVDGFFDSSNQRGQSFHVTNGGALSKVRLWLKKSGTPNGPMALNIYAHSGTFGVDSVPTGVPLATALMPDWATAITTTPAWYDFDFSKSGLVLNDNTDYVFATSPTNPVTGNIETGTDTSSPTHAGNFCTAAIGSGTFGTYTSYDLAFEVELLDITDPFTQGEKISYTVPFTEALNAGTWYWRARTTDGAKISEWTTPRSFTTTAWIPKAIANLQNWIDASTLLLPNAATFSVWPDSTGITGHDGKMYFSGAIVGLPSVRFNAQNGNRVARFTPSVGQLYAPTIGFGGLLAESTTIALTRMVGPTAGRIFGCQYGTTNWLLGHNPEDAYYSNAWISSGAVYPAFPNAWRMHAAVEGPARLCTMYVNGALLGSGTGGGGGGIASPLSLNGYDYYGQAGNCDAEVAEVLVYDRALTASELAQVHDYLNTKWALGFSIPKPHATSGAIVGAGRVVTGTSLRKTPHATTGAVVGAGATITGIAKNFTVHMATGAVVGVGRVVTGTAKHATRHATTGAVVGAGRVVTGTAKRYRTHTNVGAITQAATITGAAKNFTAHPTTGALVGIGATLAGSSLRFKPAAGHSAAGTLVGAGRVVTGTATHKTKHTATGAITQTAALAGTAKRFRAHATTGAVKGATTLAGTAKHSQKHTTTGAVKGLAALAAVAKRYRTHTTTGFVKGAAALLAGEAWHLKKHATTGAIVGPGAAMTGFGILEALVPPIYSPSRALTLDEEDRTLFVDEGDYMLALGEEDRVMKVAADDRMVLLLAEERLLIIESETRTHEVQPG